MKQLFKSVGANKHYFRFGHNVDFKRCLFWLSPQTLLYLYALCQIEVEQFNLTPLFALKYYDLTLFIAM